MNTRRKPFWRMAWWEWLILVGSLCVIFGIYQHFATEHQRRLKHFLMAAASHKTVSHDGNTRRAP